MYLKGNAIFNQGIVTQMLETLPLNKNCTLLQTSIDLSLDIQNYDFAEQFRWLFPFVLKLTLGFFRLLCIAAN